eukprot:s2223_g5.t1
MGAMGGPPSAYALSRRPWVKFVLLLQSLLCLVRIVLFLDIMGAFLMAIMIAVGYFGIREEINIQLLCYWGMMCLINGAFDLVKLIDVLVKNRMPLFSSKASSEYNIANGLALAIPVATLMGVPLAWWLFQDYSSGGEPSPLPGPGPGYRSDREGEARYTERSSLLGAGTSFTAFEGEGRRLGAT